MFNFTWLKKMKQNRKTKKKQDEGNDTKTAEEEFGNDL